MKRPVDHEPRHWLPIAHDLQRLAWTWMHDAHYEFVRFIFEELNIAFEAFIPPFANTAKAEVVDLDEVYRVADGAV